MMKRNQAWGLAQARDGNQETHVGKYPSNNMNEKWMPEDTFLER
jgi:hypothetical protein